MRVVAAGCIQRQRLQWLAVAEGFDNVSREPGSGSVFVVPSDWPRRPFQGWNVPADVVEQLAAVQR